MTDVTPSVDLTFFPRINYLKNFDARAVRRDLNGRIYGIYGLLSIDSERYPEVEGSTCLNQETFLLDLLDGDTIQTVPTVVIDLRNDCGTPTISDLEMGPVAGSICFRVSYPKDLSLGSALYDLRRYDCASPTVIDLNAFDIAYTISNSGTTFNLRSTGTVDYTVDWGDGNSETSTSNALAHTYASSGTYVVKVNSNSGSYRPYFNASGDEDQITSIAIGTDDSAVIGTSLVSAFRGANNMTEYTQVFSATSAVTRVDRAWNTCSSLTSFPLIDTSSVYNFAFAWGQCTGLTSFPALDFSNATNVSHAWGTCSSLVAFPSVDFSSVNTSFRRTWYKCYALTTFPANQFDNIPTITDSNAFEETWRFCALTAQSIENILTSLDTNGQSSKTLSIIDGTNAGKTTWSTAANTAYNNLITKGWNISYNT